MKVSENVRNAYKSNSITKHITLLFPELGKEIGTTQIYSESLRLSESILEKDSIEFVGCIASKLSIQVNNIKEDIKGRKITVRIYTDGTEDEPITLFNGIVDSALKQSNKQIKEIVAYDELYTKGNTEVAAWYRSLIFPITLKDLRDSLFEYIGLTQTDITLPNDVLLIDRKYEPNTLQALAVIKAICQINGAFGIINREGKFEYRILGKISNSYPSVFLFPSYNLFPANPAVAVAAAERLASEIQAENFSFYKKVNYEEFEVKPVDKLTIRQTENDAGVTFGSGTNNYIIQGNMFTYGLQESTLQTVAANIYPNVQGFTYYPFTSDNNGLPFLECGSDAVSYTMIDFENSTSDNISYEQKNFYILNRELIGIQALRDSYGANGEEYQTEFITDLQTQIDTIKQNTKQDVEEVIRDYDFTPEFSDFTYDKATINEMIGGAGGGFNVESVSALPENPDSNTIYLIQGIVVVK